MIVATAGHVDHGKTTLVRALTGVDTDRLPQEKARGMSIDLGFAYLRAPGLSEPIAFIDVPGHERFVRNMIAGVHRLDLALLVIAADDGPMPQTREHLAILLALGAPRALVALTKVDRVDAARRARALEEIDHLLAASRFAGAPVFPVVGPEGQGIATLLAALETIASETRASTDRTDPKDARFRLHVDRSFVLPGIGLVATGTVLAGHIAVGDEVWVSRHARSARVRSLRANDTEASLAQAGQRCALALSGFSREDAARGDVLTGLGPIAPTRRIDLLIADAAPPGEADLPASRSALLPRSGRSVLVCLGTQAVRGTLSPVGPEGSARDSAPTSRLARLTLDVPVTAFLGDALLLRDPGRNTLLAGGIVLDPRPPQHSASRRRQAERLRSLAAIWPETGSPDLTAVLSALLSVPRDGVDLDWLRAVSGATPAALDRALAESGAVRVEAGDAVFACSAGSAAAAQDALESAVDQWHLDQPQQLGPRQSDLLPRLRDWPVAIVQASLATALSRGTLIRTGPSLRRPAHRPTLSAADTRLWQLIAPTLEDGQDPKPPRVHELAERFAMPPSDVESFLVRISLAGRVYRVAHNRFFLPRTVIALGRLARALADEGAEGRFDAASFRSRSGLGRNLTIEVLEFLDGLGFTRRVGDSREVVGDPGSLDLDAD